MHKTPAIVILGAASLPTARRIQRRYPQAPVYALQGRVEADIAYADFGATLRALYQSGTPIVALCAAGIVIRSLAPVLADKEQEPPVLAVRLQELFGLAATPRIAGGRLGVKLHLLSPAQRPVQVTQDLASFWANTYAEVKKDLKGRYPKHYWPDDPLVAEPTARAKPRKPS